MPGHYAFTMIIALLMIGVLAMAVQPAAADETYSLDKDFKRANSDIVIHLLYVNVTDKYMGNIYPSLPPEKTKWAHLVYQYENTGDKEEVGSIQYELIDTQGNVYPFNPDQDEYSGESVKPHSKSGKRWNEIPIPRDTVLAKVHVFEGTNPDFLLANETYDIRLMASASPSALPPGPSAATPGPARLCAPLLPFAVVAGVGAAGLYVKNKFH